MIDIKSTINVRSMILQDMDAILFIDHKIREAGKAVTYANITTERFFKINRHVGLMAKPISYADLISGDVSELFELGLVAEFDGHVRGFILGRISHVGTIPSEVGTILILGVHPEYQRKGIAFSMVNALCDIYRAKGVKKLNINIDRHDKDLLSFCENCGFDVGQLIEYKKKL
jgi:ribosomal protein S18 acetylase RimI-like enzyme